MPALKRMPAPRHSLVASAALAAWTCGSALLPSTSVAGSGCKVMDFAELDLMPILQSAAEVRTVAQTVSRTVGPPVAGTASSGDAGAQPPRDEAEAIRRTIERRDLQAFVRALPADAAHRQAALHRSLALDHAFRNAALPIVRQILRWQPDALTERFPNSNRAALEAVANEWSSLKYFERQGIPVENPPAEDDYVELLRMLLKAGADPDGHADWRPPLGMIASLPPTPATLEAARLLLAAGADINAPRPGAQPPLVFAAETANGDVTRLMLETRRASAETLEAALVKTPITGTNAVLPLLLEAGADINTRRPPSGDPRILLTPAQRAASRFKFDGERDLMKLMIRYRADPNRMTNPGVSDSPLMMVTPDIELMTGLLELGADPDYRNASGDTALLLAVRAPEPSVAPPDAVARPDGGTAAHPPGVRERSVALLLSHHADPSAENKAGESPLKAAGADDAAIVALLVQHGGTWRLSAADLSPYHQSQAPVGRYSWAVLHHKAALLSAMLAQREPITSDDCGIVYYSAAAGADATLAAVLGERGADTGVRDLGGQTPLMAAVLHNRLGAVRLLLDRRVAEVDERTPRHAGLVGGHGPPAPALLGGVTPLMLAAKLNRIEVAEELIRRGADVNAQDFGGHSVLDYARAGYGRGVVAVLQAHGARN